jgi:FkbM family methyltransferase
MRKKLNLLFCSLRNKYYKIRLRTFINKTNVIHEKLGTPYGIGVIPANFLNSRSICYSAGAGEDISFDLELIQKFKCQVNIFDPTPRSKKHYEELVSRTNNGELMPIDSSHSQYYSITPDELKLCFFHPFGVWSEDRTLKFFSPHIPEHVSHSVLNLQKTDDYFEAECKKLRSIMSSLGHQKITLLKMDIVGAEYEVIDSLIRDKIYPEILLIEFDEGALAPMDYCLDDKYFMRITQAIHKLKSAGYVLTYVNDWNATFIRESGIPSSEKTTMVMLLKRVLKRILVVIMIIIMSSTALCTTKTSSDASAHYVTSVVNPEPIPNNATAPPAQPVKLIFIHHSCGTNWLDDTNGGLGLALRDNNYFVSDTNYGWGPVPLEGSEPIGSLTDIGHWWMWFRGPKSAEIMDSVYAESGQHASYSRLNTDPLGKNRIVMFKSCYPNSNIRGNPGDPVPPIDTNPLKGMASGSDNHTVANAKGIYIDLLPYFQQHQDTLFVMVTAPPVSNAKYAGNARAFNQWMVNEWLKDYPYKNVVVFDFYNVLTTNGGSAKSNDLYKDTGNHHRVWNNSVQHIADISGQHDTTAYAMSRNDDHPSKAGNQKATAEFIPLLNLAYNQWQGG